MNIIFAGTPSFALPAFHALIQSQHTIAAVYTQPDKPAGRGLKLTASPIKQAALAQQLPVLTPASLKEEAVLASLARIAPDAIVVAAYGLLLPKAVLALPRFGCVNIHPSLLPRWRGAAPIPRAIEAGDEMTGVTIMQMDAGLDTGPILLQQSYALVANETASSLSEALSHLSAKLLVVALDGLEAGTLCSTPQAEEGVLYAKKLEKEEGRIHWQEAALVIERKVRAFNPWPVAYTLFCGEPLRLFEARATDIPSNGKPGALLQASNDRLLVNTTTSALELLTVQLPGRKMISARDFYHAKRHQLIPGVTCLE